MRNKNRIPQFVTLFLLLYSSIAYGTMSEQEKMQRQPWLFGGLNVGLISTTTDNTGESDKAGYLGEIKAEVDWYRDKFIFGIGSGFFYSHISGDNPDFANGTRQVDTWSLFVDGTASYRFSDTWQIGPTINAFLSAEDVSFSEEDPAPDSTTIKKISFFAGLKAAHDIHLDENILRVTGKAMVDFDIQERTVFYLTIGVAYGWGLSSAPREERQQEVVREEYKVKPLVSIIDEPIAAIVAPKTIRVRFGETYLRFKTDSDEISEYGKAVINSLASYLIANSDSYERLLIAGHTDERNTEAYNLDLSRRRAKSTAREFVRNGISSGRIRIKGYGESKPIFRESTPEAWAVNRRVEIFISGVVDEKRVTDEINSLQL